MITPPGFHLAKVRREVCGVRGDISGRGFLPECILFSNCWKASIVLCRYSSQLLPYILQQVA